MTAVLLLFLLFTVAVGEWNEPPFEQTSDSHINSWSYSDNTLNVHINESIIGSVHLAKLNYDDTDKTVQLDFVTANEEKLGANIVDKKLIVTKTQNYENKNQQNYIFYVIVNKNKKKVFLVIDDIDDTAPEITNEQEKCEIKENYKGKSNCTFHIKDTDGVINDIKYEIKGNNVKINELFEMKAMPTTTSETKIVLNVLKELNYETMNFYFFTLNAIDSGNNSGSTTVQVQVQDENDEKPVWQKIPTTVPVDEGTPYNFTIYAVDGDRYINAKICYEISPKHSFISIPDRKTGLVSVSAISLENPEKNITSVVVVAYEEANTIMNTSAEIKIVVKDINDHAPEIRPRVLNITVSENTYMTIGNIIIQDNDMGQNAQYNVTLKTKDVNIDITAFQIIPPRGYQSTNFFIRIINATALDYDRTEYWRDFTIQIVSDDGHNTDESEVHITLQNWNDEIPKFENESYVAKLKESTPENYVICTVHAHDDDIDDTVIYSIGGTTFQNLLSINSSTGEIKTMQNNIFDYEKQKIIIIQIQAVDTLGARSQTHTVFTQLTITLLNVNDEAPQIRLSNQTSFIDENSPIGTFISNITAFDPDEELSELKFDIDWSLSKASKEGILVADFINCVKIDTCKDKNKGGAIGIITVNGTIDFEAIEVLNIFITVTDKRQDPPNSDNVTIFIYINDQNDNPPRFDMESIESKKNVVEKSERGKRIDTLIAHDIDGLNNNIIAYSMREIENTPPGLVSINETTGEIIVNGNINADSDLFYLNYTVVAFDPSNKSLQDIQNITIYIIDTNDNFPKLTDPLNPIEVNECTTSQELQQVKGIDYDRDDMFKTITYKLNTLGHPELQSVFFINPISGVVTINDTSNCSLDRDNGKPEYTLYIVLNDNYGGQGISNHLNVEFNLKLLDINNQRPYIELKELNSITENYNETCKIDTIIANDADEPNTNNSKIIFRIAKVYGTDQDLFKINEHGDFLPTKWLNGFFGEYVVSIATHDLGIPQLTDLKNFTVKVSKYNFKPPLFIFPHEGDEIFLIKDQQINNTLYALDGKLSLFMVDDQQNNKFQFEFHITTQQEDKNVFKFVERGHDKSELQLQTERKKDNYELTIEAKHDGTGSAVSNVFCHIKIYFIDPNSGPHFTEHSMDINFMENSLNETKVIKEAISPDNRQIFYHIYKSDVNKFKLDAKTGNLTLTDKLDREQAADHEITVAASYNNKCPENPQNDSLLNVHVAVLDENDNPPKFKASQYTSGLTTDTAPDTYILPVEYHDPDLSDENKLIVHYLHETLFVSDDSLNSIKKTNAFWIKDNKEIFNAFQPQEGMHGYVRFKIRVYDTAQHYDETLIKVFLISKDNLVVFKFNNDKEKVQEEREFIADVFTKVLKYTCIVDSVHRIQDNETEIKTHFFDEDVNPINKNVIMTKTTDMKTLTILQVEFSHQGLNFSDIPEKDIPKNIEKLLKILLIVISVILGVFCIILIVTLIIRSRSLKRQLIALKTKDSSLNPAEINAPNTNRHAFETNPVWKQDIQIDAISQGSDTSDLIGIEDNPEFQFFSNEYKESILDDEPIKESTNSLVDTDVVSLDCRSAMSIKSDMFRIENIKQYDCKEIINPLFEEHQKSINPLASGNFKNEFSCLDESTLF